MARFQGGKPLPARTIVLSPRGDEWTSRSIDDPDSNVFHKALYVEVPGKQPGILTLGGNQAAVKLWQPDGNGFRAQTIWATSFGGTQNRMRDGELVSLRGKNSDLVVATHDQGVVAVVPLDGSGPPRELDRKPGIWVHEIEAGDLDGDGTPEIYATPSEPNDLSAQQRGKVLQYLPSAGDFSTVVDLGERHAKEILVSDVDGDGRDELYVSVEGKMYPPNEKPFEVEIPVEIRRYDWTPRGFSGVRIATLDDSLCRFLTAGDVDGNGRREMIAAPYKAGIFLLRPQADPRSEWSVERIDQRTAGFEHASLLADLDADGVDELYVADDSHGEVHRYRWNDGKTKRDTIFRYPPPAGSAFTWNITSFPLALLDGLGP